MHHHPDNQGPGLSGTTQHMGFAQNQNQVLARRFSLAGVRSPLILTVANFSKWFLWMIS